MSSFFTADTHFGHANIIKYCNRPFASVQEHDQTLIKNWNSVVSRKDSVYHLGDFGFGPLEFLRSIRIQLNGNIFFIQGNHDRVFEKLKGTLAWFRQVSSINVNQDGIIQEIFLSHYAHRVWNKSFYKTWHLYGHSHAVLPDDINSLSMDVGVDAYAALNVPNHLHLSTPHWIYKGEHVPITLLNPLTYRPFSLQEINDWMSKKIFKI